MSQVSLRRRAPSPEIAQEIVARMLEAHDYRVMPLGLSGYLIPAAVLPDLLRRAFETVEKRLTAEGPRALTAYMPLLSKYDLHTLELCKSAEELSRELAGRWAKRIRTQVRRGRRAGQDRGRVFGDYDHQKSHGRSISREKARGLGLPVTFTEDVPGLFDLVRSLRNQYEFFLEKTPFYKVFEDARGTAWGRHTQSVTLQIPIPLPGAPQPSPTPQPGPPAKTA